jgi:F-type H+-transporting ATPase subunit b
MAMLRYAFPLALLATPVMAAGDTFFSLSNTDFVVTLGFLVFVGILLYFKVPAMVGGMLDTRAARIKAELDEARALREEARALLASYDKRTKDVQEQAARIVASAREEAQAAAVQAKADLKKSIDRRLAAAQDKIASAEKDAVRQVRERAVAVAVAAAGDVLAKQATVESAGASIDAAIAQVEARLH